MKSMLVIAGPSAVGKTTVSDEILRQNAKFTLIRSATTRAPRGDGHDGEYLYLGDEDFRREIASGGMLEYTEYCGNFYGTPLKEAQEVLDSGKNLILEIEVEGARNIKNRFPEAVLIMLLPPSFKVQEQRLRGRGTETEEKILERLARTREEILMSDFYDYAVYNYDGADKIAANEIYAIVTAEKHAMKRSESVSKTYFE